MDKYLIREMVESDINEVIKGEEEVFGDSLGFDLIYSDFSLNPLSYYFVLEINKKVCGCLSFWLTDEVFDIINLHVIKKYQNQGYGTMFMKILKDLTISSNVSGISLEVRKSNEKAISFYKKHGFEYVRVRQNYYSNHEDALVYMWRVEK